MRVDEAFLVEALGLPADTKILAVTADFEWNRHAGCFVLRVMHPDLPNVEPCTELPEVRPVYERDPVTGEARLKTWILPQ